MKLIHLTLTGLAFVSLFAGCTKDLSPAASTPVTPTEAPHSPVVEAQPKEGHFSVREIRSGTTRNLGQYVSGTEDAGISCKLIDVPDSAYGKLIKIEAMWTFENPYNAEKSFYRVRIESQSAREIFPGKNSYDFVDAQVRFYSSKARRAVISDVDAINPEPYSCDISNLAKQGTKLSGRILCSKDNVYRNFSLRLNFACTLD